MNYEFTIKNNVNNFISDLGHMTPHAKETNQFLDFVLTSKPEATAYIAQNYWNAELVQSLYKNIIDGDRSRLKYFHFHTIPAPLLANWYNSIEMAGPLLQIYGADHYLKISKKLRNQRDFAIKALNFNPMIVQHLADTLRSDETIALIAIKGKPSAVAYITGPVKLAYEEFIANSLISDAHHPHISKILQAEEKVPHFLEYYESKKQYNFLQCSLNERDEAQSLSGENTIATNPAKKLRV